MNAVEMLEQIRRLPPEEQYDVAEQGWAEFGDAEAELTPEQHAELERRAEEFRNNPQDSKPWEQARDDVRQRLGWK
jgi:putative addiction module component (TIGR02574 family)